MSHILSLILITDETDPPKPPQGNTQKITVWTKVDHLSGCSRVFQGQVYLCSINYGGIYEVQESLVAHRWAEDEDVLLIWRDEHDEIWSTWKHTPRHRPPP